MATENDVFTTCDRCEADIRYGEPQVTINRNVEQVENVGDGPHDLEIDILESDAMVTLCAKCGNRFTAEILDKAIRAIIAR